MRSWTGVGVMAGSSLDGIDLALCRYSLSDDSTWAYELLESALLPLESQWIERLNSLPEGRADVLAKAHVDFGHTLGRFLASFCAQRRLSPDFVAVHGPTVFHQPEKGFTFQLGNGEVIASYGEWPVVSEFRSKDIALGGQGAPLVPEGERLLFPEIDLFLNLGGIVNLSLPAAAFDVCVGNQVLNDLARKIDPSTDYDCDGRMARSGSLDSSLLESLENHPWYKRRPPKSLGREWYEAELVPLLAQSGVTAKAKLRTLVEHIRLRIEAAVCENHDGAGRMMITGGGAENLFLVERLRSKLEASGISIHDPDLPGLTLYKEAIVFGFLGLLNLLGRENVRGSLTGARISSVCGSIHMPARGGEWLGKFAQGAGL